MEDGLPTMVPTTTRRRGRLVAGFAVAAILFLGACSGDDDDSEGAGSSDGSGEATETTTADEQAGAAEDAEDAEGAAAGGDDQAFCDWFTSVGPNSMDWDMEEAAAQTPPAAIAEQFQAIVDGTASLTQESEVTRWATDNCF